MGDLHPEHLDLEMQKECPWKPPGYYCSYPFPPEIAHGRPTSVLNNFIFFPSASNLFSERSRTGTAQARCGNFHCPSVSVPPVGLPSMSSGEGWRGWLGLAVPKQLGHQQELKEPSSNETGQGLQRAKVTVAQHRNSWVLLLIPTVASDGENVHSSVWFKLWLFGWLMWKFWGIK